MNERITFASMMVKHLDLPSITYFVRTGLFGYNVDVFIAISNVPPVIVIISISLNILCFPTISAREYLPMEIFTEEAFTVYGK